ncbi:putative pentatricopeptide repeat-containing protein At5g09950 [Fagus crenata]
MFRWFFTCTHTHSHHHRRKLHYNSNPALTTSTTTTFTVSPLIPPQDKTLFLKPQLPTNHLRPSSPSIPTLQNLVDHYKTSKSQVTKHVLHSGCSETLEFLVSRYRDSSCPKDAKELHLQIFKYGFVNDMFLCNTLINIYARNGDLGSAPCQECRPCGVKFGVQIHGLMSKTRYAFDVVVCNVLISMYGNCLGSADDARRVFDQIEIRNSISWNSIISVYSQRGEAISAFQFFSRMEWQGSGFTLKPNEYTFGSLITAACSSVDTGSSLLKQMLARVKKSGHLGDMYVGSALVSGFARFGLIDYAKQIFEQMGKRNAVSMNGLMVGLVRQKRGEEAAKVFMEMRNLVDINLDSYVILLSAFPEFAVLEDGKRKGTEVHGYVIRTGLIDIKREIGNGLVNMYAKCGAIADACSVFGVMGDKDSVSWNTMISGLDQNECFEDAVNSFVAMRKTGLMPSNFTLISTLSSCASLGWRMLGQQIHCEEVKLGLDLDVSVSNALLALYAETGCLTESEKVFSLMPDYDQVSWNSIIGAFANSEASVVEAVKYLLNMMRAGWSLNRVSFINILAAVSSLSLHQMGHQIHGLVLKYCVANDTAIENALLAYYGKCGEIDECEKIFSRMSERRDELQH